MTSRTQWLLPGQPVVPQGVGGLGWVGLFAEDLEAWEGSGIRCPSNTASDSEQLCPGQAR